DMHPNSFPRPRVWAFVVVSLLAVLICGWIAPAWQQAVAQDGPAAAAASDPAAGDSTPPKAEDSLFMHIVKSAGPIFGPLLLFLSVALVALIVMLALDLRLSVAIPPGFV